MMGLLKVSRCTGDLDAIDIIVALSIQFLILCDECISKGIVHITRYNKGRGYIYIS